MTGLTLQWWGHVVMAQTCSRCTCTARVSRYVTALPSFVSPSCILGKSFPSAPGLGIRGKASPLLSHFMEEQTEASPSQVHNYSEG